ncbi:MAG: MerR family transcriptional regulator [Rhodospirillaceae bacterium]|nr:MerR family transcriptional regulator [Rhodospirillaceae bacterium]MDE0616482.1 MerR family transcriptional regulator [Rhodospirillaceae bacterium]
MASSNDDPANANRGMSRRTKSADAFRTISEVSGEVGVPQHVLRFWETKFSQIKPLKRGGGRRYYRPEDIDLLNRIRAWLYDDGYTIKGVQKLLREGGTAASSGAGRASAAAERAQAGGDGHAPAGPAAPERTRAAPEPPVLRRPEAAPEGVAAGEAGAGGSAAAPVGEAPRAADAAVAGPDPEAPESADRISLERASLASLIDGLEEVRDRLRGPPPEP